MRRSFRGNKLYAAVFREYLHQLFSNGYSVKYFTEGGRSRTGRLLAPKTGMIAMTVQGLLRGIDRPITLVPVYLGYDHVMEVSTYHSELKGKSKEKESVSQVVKTLRKLKNFGQAYVNFGEPIQLNKLLDDKVENWRDAIDDVELLRVDAALMEQASTATQLRFNQIFLRTLIKRLTTTSEELARYVA